MIVDDKNGGWRSFFGPDGSHQGAFEWNPMFSPSTDSFAPHLAAQQIAAASRQENEHRDVTTAVENTKRAHAEEQRERAAAKKREHQARCAWAARQRRDDEELARRLNDHAVARASGLTAALERYQKLGNDPHTQGTGGMLAWRDTNRAKAKRSMQRFLGECQSPAAANAMHRASRCRWVNGRPVVGPVTVEDANGNPFMIPRY
jgi:hypothetical protein